MTLAIDLTFTASTGRAHVPWLRKHLRATTPLLPPNKLEDVSIVLVGDAAMARLHVQFMNIPGPTDVLTFPLDVDTRGRATSGEIVVCVPEAKRRARPGRFSDQVGILALREELLLYTLHGILHLCGLDDRTAGQFRRMHRMEDQILRKLGVGPVFHRKEPDAGTRRAR